MQSPRLVFAFVALLALNACGVTFSAQTVAENDTPLDVSVVEMTPTVVAQANKSAYTPLSLPAAFGATV